MKIKRISKTTTKFWMKGMEKNNLHDLRRFKLRPNYSNMSHKSNYTNHMSNGKSGYPGCLGDLLGMGYGTHLYGDYFINHEISGSRILKQPVWLMESIRPVFFSWLTWVSNLGNFKLKHPMWLEAPCENQLKIKQKMSSWRVLFDSMLGKKTHLMHLHPPQN